MMSYRENNPWLSIHLESGSRGSSLHFFLGLGPRVVQRIVGRQELKYVSSVHFTFQCLERLIQCSFFKDLNLHVCGHYHSMHRYDQSKQEFIGIFEANIELSI